MRRTYPNGDIRKHPFSPIELATDNTHVLIAHWSCPAGQTETLEGSPLR